MTDMTSEQREAFEEQANREHPRFDYRIVYERRGGWIIKITDKKTGQVWGSQLACLNIQKN
jgi:hypothetical protein